jgi:hypothetical protein
LAQAPRAILDEKTTLEPHAEDRGRLPYDERCIWFLAFFFSVLSAACGGREAGNRESSRPWDETVSGARRQGLRVLVARAWGGRYRSTRDKTREVGPGCPYDARPKGSVA